MSAAEFLDPQPDLWSPNPKLVSWGHNKLLKFPSLSKLWSRVVNLVVLCENVAFTIKTHANLQPSLLLVLPQ